MPTRSELQAMLQQSRERFDAAVKGVDDATLESQAVCGVWSSRDVAGHLADWNDEFIAAVEHALGGEAPAGHPIEDGEAYNMGHAAARSSQPWAAARADFDGSVERLAALLRQVDDERLATPAMQPWGEDGTVAEVIFYAPDHMNEHIVDLENSLSR